MSFNYYRKFEFALLALLLAAVPALSSLSPATAAGSSLKIGVMGPFSGPLAEGGGEMRQSVALAVEVFGAAGSMAGFDDVEMVSVDSECRLDKAVDAARQLIDKGVSGVVGAYCSSATAAAAPLFHAAGIIEITPASARADLTEQGYDKLFRTVLRDDAEARAAIGFLSGTLKVQRLFLIDDRQPDTQRLASGIVKIAKKTGRPAILAREHISPRDKDFTIILTLVQKLKPDAVFLAIHQTAGALFVRQLKALGIEAAIVSGKSLHNRAFVQNAPRSAQGSLLVFIDAPPPSEARKAFERRFKARWNAGQLSTTAYLAYDAAVILLQAFKTAETTDSRKVAAILRHTRWEGTTGPIVFDSRGDRRFSVRTLVVGQGGFKDWNTPPPTKP